MTGPGKIRRVFMIGFMGAGKSTAGRILAQRLGWKFYDLDEMIEARQQMSIARIFAEAGESNFRRIENEILMELLESSRDHDCVVALGGGAFVQAYNREALQRAGGVSVLLEAPVEELHRRCSDGRAARPLAQDREKFNQLFASRKHAYELADLRIQTAGKSIEQVAAELEYLLNETRELKKSEVKK